MIFLIVFWSISLLNTTVINEDQKTKSVFDSFFYEGYLSKAEKPFLLVIINSEGCGSCILDEVKNLNISNIAEENLKVLQLGGDSTLLKNYGYSRSYQTIEKSVKIFSRNDNSFIIKAFVVDKNFIYLNREVKTDIPLRKQLTKSYYSMFESFFLKDSFIK